MDLRIENSSSYRLGIILAIGAVVWSGTYSSLAKGLTPFLSPVTLLLLSEGLTAIFIIITFGIVPLFRSLTTMSISSFWIAAFIGLLNSAIAPYFWFTGLSMTTATNASLLGAGEVIWAIILSCILLKERVSRMQVLGIFIVLIGIVVINVGPAGEPLEAHIGDLFILIGGIASGTGAVIFKKYLSHVMPELAILIRNITAFVAVAFLGFLFSLPLTAEVTSFPLEKVLLLLAFTFFSRYLVLTFFYEGLDRLPATTFSMIQIGGPLSGLIFAWLILGEQILPYHALGAIFIIFGLLLEQTSAQAIRSLRTRPFFTLFHFFHHKDKSAIPLMPKNV